MPVRCVRVCGGIRAADTAPADLLQLRQVTNLWVFYIACAYIPPPPTAEPLFFIFFFLLHIFRLFFFCFFYFALHISPLERKEERNIEEREREKPSEARPAQRGLLLLLAAVAVDDDDGGDDDEGQSSAFSLSFLFLFFFLPLPSLLSRFLLTVFSPAVGDEFNSIRHLLHSRQYSRTAMALCVLFR